ncbi:unnamed protein product [Allacma fusca]|uniref:DOMON domain-containing protein n=1 Tax=Allacma fusca TaxID=39272 RepID=A0A8J2LTC4_9HEXA|nr:unnamed protein product [Allacma fusca]
MELDVRAMHRFCTGKCFFLTDDCKTEERMSRLECRNIVAIKEYKPPCKAPIQPSAVELCKREGHLFIVSLLGQVEHEKVRSKDREVYKKVGNELIKCGQEPYVAIAFTDDATNSFVPSDPGSQKLGDVFYTCTANQPYVTSWVKSVSSHGPNNVTCLKETDKIDHQQLLDTKPYPPMGVSVLWSKITMRTDQYAIGCKFIISTEEPDLTVKLDNHVTIVPVFQTKKLKIANGIAFTLNGVLESLHFSAADVYIHQTTRNKIERANLASLDGIMDWNSSDMKALQLSKASFLAPAMSYIAKESMDDVYDLCLNKQAMCFTRNDERSCMIRRNCHLLASIRSLDREFTRVRFNLISQHPQRKGIVSLTHPQNWAAIGFSNDTKMGKDLVISCVYRGTTHLVYTGYNADHMFIYKRLHDNPEGFVQVKDYIDMDSESTMCVFDMSTDDILLRAFYYSKLNASIEDDTTWTELYWSMRNHEFFVFLAQGTTSDTIRDRISYHIYRGVSNRKFSRKLYLKLVGRALLTRANDITLFFLFASLYLIKLFKA